MLKIAKLRCRVCRERPRADGTDRRCEACWTEAAKSWLWHGHSANAFEIVVRRSGMVRRERLPGG